MKGSLLFRNSTKGQRKEKFCIQISQNSLIINSSYRLIKKAKLEDYSEFYCELPRFNFSMYISLIHSPG